MRMGLCAKSLGKRRKNRVRWKRGRDSVVKNGKYFYNPLMWFF